MNVIELRIQDEPKELAVKEFNGQRVVTFKDIDELHERVAGTA
ncbi:ORF6N domain-containing protein, partial [Bacillus thuringiensis]